MIDLHLHTTASDGCCSPEELVDSAWQAGVTVISVTDHDTTAAARPVAERAVRRGIEAISGIEITAVEGTKDVHVLGYFLAPASGLVERFLVGQREDRVRRTRAMAERLARLGAPIDLGAALQAAAEPRGRSIGRPQVALALLQAGHVATLDEAFERFIGEGKPAYVPRTGAAATEVVRIIHQAGGLASLAHPGLLQRDDLLPALASAGLDAIEVFHPEHTAEQQAHYRALAARHGLAVTGGSDFHGDRADRPASLGLIGLPPAELVELRHRAARKRSAPH